MNDEHFDSEIETGKREGETPYPRKSQSLSSEISVWELSVALMVITVSISCG